MRLSPDKKALALFGEFGTYIVDIAELSSGSVNPKDLGFRTLNLAWSRDSYRFVIHESGKDGLTIEDRDGNYNTFLPIPEKIGVIKDIDWA